MFLNFIYVILFFISVGFGCGEKPQDPPTDPTQVSHPETAPIFSSETKQHVDQQVIRLLQKKTVISRGQMIHLLNDKSVQGTDFRKFLNKMFADIAVATDGYQVKAPIINATTKDEDFYWVIVPAAFTPKVDKTFYPYFIHCQEAALPRIMGPAYKSHFVTMVGDGLARIALNEDKTLANGTVAFVGGTELNPDQNKIMVSPCPRDPATNQAVQHLKSYVSSLEKHHNQERLQSFWYTVGLMASRMFDGTNLRDNTGAISAKTGLFLNTHGHGVSYLHFRVELSSSYYGGVEALTTNTESVAFYRNLFGAR